MKGTSQDHIPMADGQGITWKRIIIFILGSFIPLIIICGSLFGFGKLLIWNWNRSFPPADPLTQEKRIPPLPHLQVHGAKDLREKIKSDREKAVSYGWVDVQAGIVRIPIDRAMEITVQRGFSVRGVEQ